MLEALMAGLGLLSESSSQGAAQQLGWAQLNETKRSNKKKEKLATSDKVDARGNRTYYDPTFGWRIDTNPETQKILEAEDLETLLSLTEDATRNRDASKRMDKRSIAGDDEFENVFNEYKYRDKKPESVYIADAQKEKLLARRKGADEAAANVNKSLIRQGNSSAIPGVFKQARDAEADAFEEVLLGGKRQGMQDFLNFEGGKDQKAQGELGFLEGLASKTSGGAPRFTNRADTLTGGADNAMAQLLQVLASNDGAEQGAMQNLQGLVGQSPNFAPFASALGKIGAGMTGQASGSTAPVAQRQIPYPRPYEEGVRARLRAGF